VLSFAKIEAGRVALTPQMVWRWAVAEGRCVQFSVEDTGIGIPADKLESIFQPFVQLGRYDAGGKAGSGLGLAISRDLARAMRGDVTVESTVGRGSKFVVTMPRRVAEGAA